MTYFAEVASPAGTLRQARVAAYDHTSPVTKDPRAWRGSTLLADEGQIGPWARQERQRFEDDQAFVQFLMARFRNQFTYSTATAYDPDRSSLALDQFFFDGMSGYCSFFAQSMATALRAVGIPAHVVTGYMGGDWNDFGGYWMIRNNMAHAWVEAYFSDQGWVRFDPTLLVAPGLSGGRFAVDRLDLDGQPAAGSTQTGDRPNYLIRASMWVDSLNTNITRSIMQFGGNSRGSLKSRISGMDFETLIWILGGMMTSIVVVTAGTTLVRRFGIMGRDPGLKLEQQFVQILEHSVAKTAPRQPAEGLMTFAARLDAGAELSHDARDVAVRIAQVRFGATPLSRDQAKRLMADLAALKSRLKA